MQFSASSSYAGRLFEGTFLTYQGMEVVLLYSRSRQKYLIAPCPEVVIVIGIRAYAFGWINSFLFC